MLGLGFVPLLATKSNGFTVFPFSTAICTAKISTQKLILFYPISIIQQAMICCHVVWGSNPLMVSSWLFARISLLLKFVGSKQEPGDTNFEPGSSKWVWGISGCQKNNIYDLPKLYLFKTKGTKNDQLNLTRPIVKKHTSASIFSFSIYRNALIILSIYFFYHFPTSACTSIIMAHLV